jgi:hypothetical protein
MVELNDQEEQNNNQSKNSEARADILDFVSPYLEPVYEIFIEPFVKKYGIKVPNSFIFFISMFIFSIITIYFGLNYQGAALLFLLALLILIGKNKDLIINTITKKILLNKGKLVDEFIKNIDEKELDETKRFILNNSRELTSNDLILLMKSKFFDNSSFHMSILKSQIIDSELLDFMIENELDQKIGEDIFCDYLKYCSNSISHKSYELLATRHEKDEKIIQTQNACFPYYLKNHSIFKYLANIRIQIKESINYGNVKKYIFVFWGFFGLFAISTHPISVPVIPQIASSNETSRLLSSGIMLINFTLSFILTIAIFMVVTLYIIMWLLRRYRTILCYFAPKSTE